MRPRADGGDIAGRDGTGANRLADSAVGMLGLQQQQVHRLFDTARLVNCALIAKIHTIEWTPAICAHPTLRIGMRANWWGLVTERITRTFGRLSSSEAISGIPGSPVNHHATPFALTEEFVSVYRMHPLIPDDIRLLSHSTGHCLKELTFADTLGRKALGTGSNL